MIPSSFFADADRLVKSYSSQGTVWPVFAFSTLFVPHFVNRGGSNILSIIALGVYQLSTWIELDQASLRDVFRKKNGIKWEYFPY